MMFQIILGHVVSQAKYLKRIKKEKKRNISQRCYFCPIFKILNRGGFLPQNMGSIHHVYYTFLPLRKSANISYFAYQIISITCKNNGWCTLSKMCILSGSRFVLLLFSVKHFLSEKFTSKLFTNSKTVRIWYTCISLIFL